MERNLRFINRFSIYHTNRPESVAEHAFYVTYYAWIIAKEFQEAGIEINFKLLFEKALVHDMEEIYTGDIWKYAKDREVKKDLKNVTKRLLSKDIYDIWVNAKDDSIEGQIVEFTDNYEVLIYCLEEIKSGNRHLVSVFKNQVSILKQTHPIFKKYLNKVKKDFNKIYNK